jgi:phosphate transport system substrate-binding protein
MFQTISKGIKRVGMAAAILTAGIATTTLADVRIQGAGATFPNPLYQKWVSEYQKAHPEVKIDYQSVGSGGGITGITQKTVDFAGSDAPLSKKEIEAIGAKVLQIPSTAGAVVLAYNLPNVSGDINLSGPVVAEIFMGKITKWNDPKIAALNADAKLPDSIITPVYRTDGSGTTFVFTSYLAAVSPDFKDAIGKGKQVKFPSGQGGKGNDGVTAAIQQTPGGIGYVELNFALANKLPFALMQNKDGKFVKASMETVAAAGEGAVKEMTPDKMAIDIWNQPGEKSYPISAFTYFIVYADLSNVKEAENAKALTEFLKWAESAEGGQKLSPSMDYAPLAPAVQEIATKAIESLTYKGQAMK